MNIVASDGETWRIHRRLLAPAFNNKLCGYLSDGCKTSDARLCHRYDLVWTETQKTYNQMLKSEQWHMKTEVTETAVQNLTFKVSLLFLNNQVNMTRASTHIAGASYYSEMWIWVPIRVGKSSSFGRWIHVDSRIAAYHCGYPSDCAVYA